MMENNLIRLTSPALFIMGERARHYQV